MTPEMAKSANLPIPLSEKTVAGAKMSASTGFRAMPESSFVTLTYKESKIGPHPELVLVALLQARDGALRHVTLDLNAHGPVGEAVLRGKAASGREGERA